MSVSSLHVGQVWIAQQGHAEVMLRVTRVCPRCTDADKVQLALDLLAFEGAPELLLFPWDRYLVALARKDGGTAVFEAWVEYVWGPIPRSAETTCGSRFSCNGVRLSSSDPLLARDDHEWEDRALDEVARVVTDPEQAVELAVRAGFPESRLPRFTTALGFWARVVREARYGVLPHGALGIIEAARRDYPNNEKLVSLTSRLVEHFVCGALVLAGGICFGSGPCPYRTRRDP